MNWLLDHLWPFSEIRRLRATVVRLNKDIALRESVHADYVRASDRYYAFLRVELGGDKVDTLDAGFDALAREDYARIGAEGRPDKLKSVFPPQGTGRIDPRLQGIALEFAETNVRLHQGIAPRTDPKPEDVEKAWDELWPRLKG